MDAAGARRARRRKRRVNVLAGDEHERRHNTERWLSGLRCSPGKRVYGDTVPRVQIPPSPPDKKAPRGAFLVSPGVAWPFEPGSARSARRESECPFELRSVSAPLVHRARQAVAQPLRPVPSFTQCRSPDSGLTAPATGSDGQSPGFSPATSARHVRDGSNAGNRSSRPLVDLGHASCGIRLGEDVRHVTGMNVICSQPAGHRAAPEAR